jgi:hypothetical protein
MVTEKNPRALVGLLAVVVGAPFVACDVEDGDYEDELWDERNSDDAAVPDLTLAALIQNGNQLPFCGAGSVSVTVDEVNLGVGGVGPFYIHLLDAATGQPAAAALLRPALAGNSFRTSTLTFNPYLGPCDVVQCVPGSSRSYDLFIDGGNLWAESDESNNRLGTLTYVQNCSLYPICPPLACPAPVEPYEPADG